MSVVVVGAGIVGLTTAAHIQDLLPSVKVTVIADKFNTETTSDGAAGLFYPASNFKGPTPSSAKDWMRYSYKYYENLLNEECGVHELSGLVASYDSQEYVENELLVGVASEYRPATPQEMQKYRGDWKYGTFIQTLLIRCRTFLPWIIERIKSKGGQIIKKTVKDFSELKDQYDVVVNCTGLQSKYLCSDDDVAPIRGQIIKVKAPNIDQFLMSEGVYIIPNGDGLVSLGGISQYGNWNLSVSAPDSEYIRKRCFAATPELESAPVAWEWAGLRPFRETVRVETEQRDGLKLVHNYGHGGYGVTSGPGTARDAANFVKQLLQA
uniref:FAD dependent oxidoreductase domain-containing protein n=1 Tax=Graphocephala atropunctata TaxID=36148 RepID=A0A1B6M584_9HEMI